MDVRKSSAGTKIKCPKCHDRFTRPKGSSRLFCETCRPPRGHSKTVNIDEVLGTIPESVRVGGDRLNHPENNGLRYLGDIEEAVAAELFALGADSAKAKIALRLARMADRGLNTGSQLAALSKELRTIMDELHESAVPAEADPSTELAIARAERQAAAERMAG